MIFLAQHNRNGTVGFVLNRPSPYRVGGITTLTEFASNPVYFGGDCGEGTLQFVHGFDETLIPGARKVHIHLVPFVKSCRFQLHAIVLKLETHLEACAFVNSGMSACTNAPTDH